MSHSRFLRAVGCGALLRAAVSLRELEDGGVRVSRRAAALYRGRQRRHPAAFGAAAPAAGGEDHAGRGASKPLEQ